MNSCRRARNEQASLDGQRIMENQWKEKNTDLGCSLLQLMSCSVNSVEIMMADLGRKMKLGSYGNWRKEQHLMPEAWRFLFWKTYSELLCHSLKAGDFTWILETLGFTERAVGEQGKAFSGIVFKIIILKKSYVRLCSQRDYIEMEGKTYAVKLWKWLYCTHLK